MLSTGFCREHTQDTGSAANVENGLALEKMRVLDDRRAVRTRAHGVFEHLLVNT